jgi:heavy metal translocating P-type ATPase
MTAAGKAAGSQPLVDASGVARLQVKVGGMHCSFCAQTIEKAVGRLDGVEQVNVSLAHEEALIGYRPDRAEPARIRDVLRQLGYTVRDPRKVRGFAEQQAELQEGRIRLAAAATATVVVLWLMGQMAAGRGFALMPWLALALAVVVIFVIGWPILRMAVQSLRRGILNQHVLMQFGALGGLAGGLIGFWRPEFPAVHFLGAATFIATYHLLSGFVSIKVRARTSQAVAKLMALQPATARVVRDGQETELPVEDVGVGDLVRVRPGESIPVDGQVADGASAVDASLVTGEPIPEEMTAGGEVIGGSINQTGTLLVRVTRVGQDSFLAQVISHVERARALKPGLLALVDRILTVYVPAVLAVAAAALLFWTLGAWVLFGQPDWSRAIFAALAVGVMGYPCALGMATPLAMIRGGGMAAAKGILMRSAEAFQIFGQVDRIVLDKTGTLTQGRPAVAAVEPAPGVEPAQVLRLAAAVEDLSEHPLARAIVDHAAAAGIKPETVTDFHAHTGQGVTGRVTGRRVFVGKPAAAGADLTPLAGRVDALEAQARTVVAVVADDGRLVGVVAVADPVKPDAASTVAQLRRRGVEPVMLTGDNPRTAAAVAQQAGIAEVHAQMLPDQKAAKVRELQHAGRRVVMVGDGINDAPALMQADIGIALGAGTDIAIESADVIVIGHRLTAVVDAFRIGVSSYRRTKQNLAIAFVFNGVGVPAATTGLVHPIWAMAAMAASVTLVLANSFGLRLFTTRSWRRFADPARLHEEEALHDHATTHAEPPQAVPEAPAAPAEPAQLTLALEGIHCGSCKERAIAAIAALDGVIAAQPQQRIGDVQVSYWPDRTSPAAIATRLDQHGFGIHNQTPTDDHQPAEGHR